MKFMNPDDIPPALRDELKRSSRNMCHELTAASAKALRLGQLFAVLTAALVLWLIVAPLLYGPDWAGWRYVAQFALGGCVFFLWGAAKAGFQKRREFREHAEIHAGMEEAFRK